MLRQDKHKKWYRICAEKQKEKFDSVTQSSDVGKLSTQSYPVWENSGSNFWFNLQTKLSSLQK
jgi:hypothetical protein